MLQSAAVLVLAAGILWGSQGIFVRGLSAAGLSVYDICTIRITGTALLLAIFMFCCRRRLLKIRLRDIWICLGSGLISIAGFNCCYYTAIDQTSMGVAAVLMYISPALVTLAACLLFHERFTRRKALALFLALSGCTFVSGIFGASQQFTTSGILWGLGSGFCYASYSIFSVYALRRNWHPLTMMSFTFIIAAAGIMPMGDLPRIATVLSAEPLMLLNALALILLCTILAYLCYTTGLAGMEAGRAAVLAVTEAVAAAFFGIIIFHDPLTLNLLIGILCVLLSVFILNRRT